MKNIFFISAFALVALFTNASPAIALTQPLGGVTISVKPSGCTICQQSGLDPNDFKYLTTDVDGFFKVSNLKIGKEYTLSYGNDTIPTSTTVTTIDGTIRGRIVIDVYGNNGGTKTSFVYGSWNAEKIALLKAVLIQQGVLTQGTNLNTAKDLAPAIKAFQKKYGIEQTGQLGPKTVAKLNEVNK